MGKLLKWGMQVAEVQERQTGVTGVGGQAFTVESLFLLCLAVETKGQPSSPVLTLPADSGIASVLLAFRPLPRLNCSGVNDSL